VFLRWIAGHVARLEEILANLTTGLSSHIPPCGRGLPTAWVGVGLWCGLPGRLDAPVESACYFAVAEALTNVVKHSGARQAQVRIRHARGMLRVEVTDDGCGGADPARGSGLAGIEQRLGTFDGILAVSSPPGGPTMIVMEVPCAPSSLRTCSS